MAGKRSTNNKLEKLRRKISLNSFPKKYEKRTSRLSWSGRNIEAEAEERERECNPMKSHSKRERVYLFSPPLPSLYRPALTRKIAHDFSRCRSPLFLQISPFLLFLRWRPPSLKSGGGRGTTNPSKRINSRFWSISIAIFFFWSLNLDDSRRR